MHGPSQGAGPNIIPARILARSPEYVSATGPNRFEVAPLWAATPERHPADFSHPADFAAYRNRIGGLLLLPKGCNASYSALPYEDKLPHYNSQNLLARSLHPLCYAHNPSFLRFTRESGLPIRAHEDFKKTDLDARGKFPGSLPRASGTRITCCGRWANMERICCAAHIRSLAMGPPHGRVKPWWQRGNEESPLCR